LVIGQGLFATNGMDDCDEQAPPPPPAGAFDGRLSSGSTDYFIEYRPANQPGTITWLVKYQASTNGDPITFSWNPSALPGAGTWVLRDSFGGILVNVNMRTQSNLVVPYPALTQLEVVYTTTRCKVTAIVNGDWNSNVTWNTNCTGVPATTDDVYIPSGISVNFNNVATTIESLTIGNGGSLVFSSNSLLTITENAFVRGGTLNLGTTGNLSVDWKITNLGIMQQLKTVNIGQGFMPQSTVSFFDFGGYGGLTLTANATSLGNTTVRIRGGQICDTDNTSIWRCFTITPANSVTDAAVIFYYTNNELNTSTCATMEAWRSTGGRNWVSAGTVGTRSCAAEPYSVSYTNAIIDNTGSYFALRSTTGPTAVRLFSFTASSESFPFGLGLVSLAFLCGLIIIGFNRIKRR
jgi:hypothetical protein